MLVVAAVAAVCLHLAVAVCLHQAVVVASLLSLRVVVLARLDVRLLTIWPSWVESRDLQAFSFPSWAPLQRLLDLWT